MALVSGCWSSNAGKRPGDFSSETHRWTLGLQAAMDARHALTQQPLSHSGLTIPSAKLPRPQASSHTTLTLQAALAARYALTQQPLSHPGLRVVSYNILADQYAATEKAKTVFYPQCPPW